MGIIFKIELLALFVCLAFISRTGTRLVPMRKYAAGITRIHNKYRSQENASNMHMLVWDTALAKHAAAWSNNCYWGHQKRGLGENLAYQWSTGVLKPSDVIIKAIKGWYNEKFNWRWSTNCGAACHYTQMIWAKTSKIGCAYSICNLLRTVGSPIRNAHFFVCFYNPPGNYYGQYPFWYGKQCARCDMKEICQKGLCCSKAKAHLTQFLPQGKRDEDELIRQVKPKVNYNRKRPKININKISVAIIVRYDGNILNTSVIQRKYQTQIKKDVMKYLLQKNS